MGFKKDEIRAGSIMHPPSPVIQAARGANTPTRAPFLYHLADIPEMSTLHFDQSADESRVSDNGLGLGLDAREGILDAGRLE